MPVPNVATLYQKMGKGAEGGLEFARLIRLLLIARYENLAIDFISESDASGDYKSMDGYVPDKEHKTLIKIGFQYKFYPSKLSKYQRKDIEGSIEKALNKDLAIQEFVIITPEDFVKEDQQWFDDLRKKYEMHYRFGNEDFSIRYQLSLKHWGHSKIIEMALRFDHIGSKYFPELFGLGVGKFKLAEASLDCSVSRWIPREESKFSYWQSPQDKRPLTSEPVFDFKFLNNTSEILLLNMIEIYIISITSTLAGIPAKYFLRSIGTFEHTMDFKKPVNTFQFKDPLIFKEKKPLRFKFQLNDFNRCPGNHITLKFWFHFDSISISTEEFRLTL